MSITPLGDFLDEIRKRHFRLSMRQMGLDAGLSSGIASKIIKGGKGARPATLKALADRWGSDNDYKVLMGLAGHPLPEREPQINPDDPALSQLIRDYLRSHLAGPPPPEGEPRINPDDPYLSQLIRQYLRLHLEGDKYRGVAILKLLAETQGNYNADPAAELPEEAPGAEEAT